MDKKGLGSRVQTGQENGQYHIIGVCREAEEIKKKMESTISLGFIEQPKKLART